MAEDRIASAVSEKIDNDAYEKEIEMQEPKMGDDIIREAITNLFGNESLNKKTELTGKQILAMSRGEIIAAKYDIPMLQDFIRYIQKLSISKERKGRKEIVDLTQGYRGDMLGSYDQSQGLFNKLFT